MGSGVGALRTQSIASPIWRQKQQLRHSLTGPFCVIFSAFGDAKNDRASLYPCPMLHESGEKIVFGRGLKSS
jgi:hypothetical protein